MYDIKTRNFLTSEISPLYRLELGSSEAKSDKNIPVVNHSPQSSNTFLKDMRSLAARLEESGLRYIDGNVSVEEL